MEEETIGGIKITNSDEIKDESEQNFSNSSGDLQTFGSESGGSDNGDFSNGSSNSNGQVKEPTEKSI
jgi:hypothetical protein